MAKCADHWCEHYEKNKDACDQCLKNEMEIDKPDLQVILKRRAVKQMELDKGNTKGHAR